MKKITVIGGGTGTYNLLLGLKQYDVSLSAVVTAADSGGSSGRLRDEFGVLPPGDLRRCLVALSENRGDIWRQIFEYRFEGENEKNNMGNLIITALTKITGDFPTAIEAAAELLEVKGQVVPATLDNVHLCAELENHQLVYGETNIDIPKHNPELKIKRVFLEPKAFAYKKAISAIMNSDLVVIGPGDLYTSIIPNLLVEGVVAALKVTEAKVVYVCNVMTKYGETNNFSASDFIKEIQRYSNQAIDHVILNTKRPSEESSQSYGQENSFFVKPDVSGDLKHVTKADLINDSILFRHDSKKLAKIIMEIKI
ncbi:MAG: YvcK family protein [Candidatus Buchananbacteria bacterium]|nr:YvcK family protein [Candidatus Buchananbacteria bacterium]